MPLKVIEPQALIICKLLSKKELSLYEMEINEVN